MELVSLEVEQFGCIGRARIPFKPGLNVLHGANEVGKSSIARAIRFALLLPSSSKEAEAWVPWTGGGDPTVTLVFRTGPTDYYRVKKIFGTTTASIERSSDGVGWAVLARAREVEAKLRTLLEWGIPEPGGNKAPKGLPESFLASALFADQEAVMSVFDTDLDEDAADSGRARIRAALQAIAQDPLFKSVLDAAQARVDEAFTPTGQRKRGASDPFKKAAQELTDRQRERDEALQVAETARLLALRVTDLQRSAATAEGDLQEAREQYQRLEQRRARQGACAAAAAAQKAGQALVDSITEAKTKADQAAATLRDLESRLPELRKTEEEARKSFEAATAEASAAREKRQGRLAQEETAILREREALRTRQTRADSARDLRTADALRKQSDVIADPIKALDREITTLEGVEPWLELETARAALAAASRSETEAGKLLASAADLRRRAKQEWPAPHSTLLPNPRRLAELRTLRGKLDVAAGKLDVGLSVEVRGLPSVSVSVDDAPAETRVPPLSIEARNSAKLELPGGGEVLVRGGRRTDRQDAERQREQWHAETASLFESLGVADLPALEEACRLDVERKARAEGLEREAVALDAKRTALGDPAAEKQRHASRIVELEHRLEGSDLLAVAAAATMHGARARTSLASKMTERQSKRDELARLRAQEAALRERAPKDLQGAVIDDLDAEIAALQSVGAELDKRERRLAEDRKTLEAPPGSHDVLEDAAKKASKALEDALAQIKTATSDRDIWGARLEERRGPASAVDIDALEKAEDVARAATTNDGPPVDEAAIAAAANAEEAAKTGHEALVADLRKAEGALVASGGAAADERAQDLDVALQRAHEKQGALEDEYEAWRLLTETLKEAESAQATHLGNLLAPDLATRLQQLTGARYGTITLGPNLGLEGIDAAGGRRELERLSLGTREQLSTLFRLCLAERLRSALLLDDQLVQSDPDRLRWFRRALRQTASVGVQVVVLTCRPDDYLEPAESPPPHVVDLSAVVTA